MTPKSAGFGSSNRSPEDGRKTNLKNVVELNTKYNGQSTTKSVITYI
jgi:hypothetical protein